MRDTGRLRSGVGRQRQLIVDKRDIMRRLLAWGTVGA